MDFARVLKSVLVRLRTAVAHVAADTRIHARLQIGSGLALGIGLALSATLLSGILDPYQARFSDFFYQPLAPTGQVVLVAVDPLTLAARGSLPISHAEFATAVRNLLAAGTRLVASEPIFEGSWDDPTPISRLPSSVNADPDGIVRRALAFEIPGIFSAGASDSMYIRFTDPARRRVLSFQDVADGRVPPSFLRARVVLIGVTSPAAAQMSTPLTHDDQAYPVEIYMDLVETALSGRPLVQQDRLTEVTMILLMALLAGATLPHVRLLSSIGLTILYLLAYVAYGFNKFGEGVIVQPLYPVFALVLTSLAVMVYRHFADERPTELARGLFQQHVAPQVLDPLLAAVKRGLLPLGGTRREISVLCVDLSAFTALAGAMPPTAVLALLDLYTEAVVSIVFRQDGSLVRQSGDALVAAWNLPLDQRDHAVRAATAALEVKHSVLELAANQPRGLDLRLGMGIATGMAVAGRVGKRGCGDYTVVGEPVEIAERLALNTDRAILLNAAALEAVGDVIQTRQAKPMRVRGKTDLVPTWQICEPSDSGPAPYSTTFSAGPEHNTP